MDRERFKALWARCRVDGRAGAADAVFDDLLTRYSEPARRYHSPAHIDLCLQQFDLAAHLMDDPDAVELALWYHDAVYELDAVVPANELQSAELFVEKAGDGMSAEFRKRVYELIMITVHREFPTTKDQRYMIDIDLSSFGTPWELMARDSVAVREEYPHLSDEVYFPKHCNFMRSLLDREHFCFTEFFRERHEDSARRNITRQLENARKAGYV